VREILAEAASANTTRSYPNALRYWAAWFQGRFGTPIACQTVAWTRRTRWPPYAPHAIAGFTTAPMGVS